MKIKLFRRKPIEEKILREKIKTAKKSPHIGNPIDAEIGGDLASTSSGIYKIHYNKKGTLMRLSELQKTGTYTSASPQELRMLLEKTIKYSKKFNCKIMTLRTWVFAKYPELKALGFKECIKNSEKEFLEKINKRKIADEKLLKTNMDERFPEYYLEIK